MIEELIAIIFQKRKRYLRCIIGFISGLLIIEYGVLKAIFILIIASIGYISGIPYYTTKLKKYKNNFFDNIKK